MNEIGGYLEFERLAGQELYGNALKLNLGRSACAFFLSETGVKTVWLPHFLCASVPDYLKRHGFMLRFYHLDETLHPIIPAELGDAPLPSDTCFLLNNAYGQLKNEEISAYQARLGHVLLDNTHAFFQTPLSEVPTFCSVRKFLGVSDGAYLFSPRKLQKPQARDASARRFSHLLGRFEEDAALHYPEMLTVAKTYHDAPVLQMSPLTENLLGALPYAAIAERRNENYRQLAEALDERNPLKDVFRTPEGAPFVYPLLAKDGARCRAYLAEKKIYVPTYWKELFEDGSCSALERDYAKNILALPVDQRYGQNDMARVAEEVRRVLTEI